MNTTPLIIDFDNLVRRMIMTSALDDLNAGGVFTGGVFGSIASLAATLRYFSERQVRIGPIVAFRDGGTPPHRLAAIPNYKEKRAERRAILSDADKERAFAQMDLCVEAFQLLGVTVLRYKDREADDGVAAAVKLFVARDRAPMVLSTDKDLLQTVRMGASVYDMHNKRVVNANNFESVVGVPSSYYLLYRTLVGDPSDSIKGASGCGEVRAKGIIGKLQQLRLWADSPVTPVDQLKYLVDLLADAAKGGRELKAFEQSIVDDYARLEKVLHGINLENSFGGTRNVERTLDAPKTCDVLEFLRFAKRLKFATILRSPDSYTARFVAAAQCSYTAKFVAAAQCSAV